MKIFVVGTGGRESAIIETLKKDKIVKEIHSNTQNPIKNVFSVPIKNSQIELLLEYVEEHNIDFVIVGPELPLSLGIVDKFYEKFGDSKVIFGPSLSAARLEYDKSWAKDFMKKYGIPTAEYQTFDDFHSAVKYISSQPEKYVIKASGLAAGKGVFLPETKEEAEKILVQLLVEKKLGAAGEKVVIEQRLEGKEVSLFALIDGRNYTPLLPAKDYKRVYNQDRGPNTGGMGSYVPAYNIVEQEEISEFAKKIFPEIIAGLQNEKIIYRGVLYAGLIKTKDGIFVLEFNVRFGDPETQALLPLLDDSLFELLYSTSRGQLIERPVKWKDGCCINVVLASGGYPAEYETGFMITGLEKIEGNYFLAGTKRCSDGICTAGGRVLNVFALGSDLQEARRNVYEKVKKVHFKNIHYREDIGYER